MKLDVRRLRPNLVVDTVGGQPFEEHHCLAKTIRISGAALHIYMHDVRCAMINIDPTGKNDL